MKDNIIYSYLNLPPLELNWPTITDEIHFSASNARSGYPLKTFTYPGTDEEVGLCWYQRNRATPQYYDFVLELIPELKKVESKDIGFQKIINHEGHPNGVTLLPHTDGTRGTHCIHWNLDLGGPRVKTIWWKEPFQDLIRPPFTFPNNKWLDGNDISHFEKIDEVIWSSNRWGIFRTDILHSVYPVLTCREAFTVSFSDQNLYLEIIEKYGIDN